MLALLVFLLVLLMLLVALALDPVLFLHLSKAKRVRHQSFVGGLLLLFDGEQRVISNFGCGISHGVCVLYSDEVLVGSTNLRGI